MLFVVVSTASVIWSVDPYESAQAVSNVLLRVAVVFLRIASEGVLAPLEHLRVWWMLNRRVGEWVPSLSTEIQIIAAKRLE